METTGTAPAAASTGSESTRVIFTFDKESLETLNIIRDKLRFSSLAETVRESLRLANSLRLQAERGFSDVVVRNPKTGAERILVIDFLSRLAH